MPADGWVEIEHPNVAVTAVVAVSSLPQHEKAGWSVLRPHNETTDEPVIPAGDDQPEKE